MEAFKGKYERTSADKYDELLKVGIRCEELKRSNDFWARHIG